MSRRRALPVWWFGLTSFGLLLGQWIIHSSIDGRIIELDDLVRRQTPYRPKLAHLGNLLSNFGTQQFAIAGALVLSAILWRRGRRSLVWAPLIIYVGANGAAGLMKLVTDRIGPPHRYWSPGGPWYESAFPSGHATSASALFIGGALLLTLPSPDSHVVSRPVRWWAAVRCWLCVAGATIAAAAVGAARLVTQVHWFSDVVVGLALGSAWAVLVVRALHDPAPAIPQVERSRTG